jgi:hypothetical protein
MVNARAVKGNKVFDRYGKWSSSPGLFVLPAERKIN